MQLIRTLLANRAGPILMIAFTNHALDHMLVSVLEANITRRVVRLGSRSADERIAAFSLERLEEASGRSALAGVASGEYRELKRVENEMKAFMAACLKTTIDPPRILRYLQLSQLEFYEGFVSPAPWIVPVFRSYNDDNEGFKTVNRGGQSSVYDGSLYSFWLNGYDIDFLVEAHNPPEPEPREPSPPPVQHIPQPVKNPFSALSQFEDVDSDEDESSDEGDDDDSDSSDESLPEKAWLSIPKDIFQDTDIATDQIDETIDPLARYYFQPASAGREASPPSPSPSPSYLSEGSSISSIEGFFASHGYQKIPLIPSSNTSLDNLYYRDDIWGMSKIERKRIHDDWVSKIRIQDSENNLAEFERLRTKHADAVRNNNESRAAVCIPLVLCFLLVS